MLTFDPQLAIDSLPVLWAGLKITLGLSAVVLVLGLILSVPVALAQMSPNRLLSWPATAFVAVFRGMPVLVVLYLVYFGLPQFPAVRNGPFWWMIANPFACAVIGLTLNHVAYMAVVVEGSLNVIPKGLKEAAAALGIPPRKAFWRLHLPMAARYGLKAYQNEVIGFTKGTAVVSVITVTDLTAAANGIFMEVYDPFTPMLTAAAIYWLLVNLIRRGFDAVDRRLGRHLPAHLQKEQRQ